MRAISAAAPQRGGSGEADVSAEHKLEELPGALTASQTFAFFLNCESLVVIVFGQKLQYARGTVLLTKPLTEGRFRHSKLPIQ